MTKTSDSKLLVIIMAVIFGIVALAFIGEYIQQRGGAYGQQAQQQTTSEKVEQVQEEVSENSAQIDGTTLATAGGIGVGGLALAREYINSKKLKESNKRTDRDTGKSFLYMYRLIQTMDAMVPAVSKCLDTPFNADPMQKHITIRMKLAEDANSTAEYLMTQLNTTIPSMTPSAAVIVADAQNTQTTANTKSKMETIAATQQSATSTDTTA